MRMPFFQLTHLPKVNIIPFVIESNKIKVKFGYEMDQLFIHFKTAAIYNKNLQKQIIYVTCFEEVYK